MPRTSNQNKHNKAPKNNVPKKIEPLKTWLRSGRQKLSASPESPPFRGFVPIAVQGSSINPIDLAQYIPIETVNESMKEETMDAHDLATAAGIKTFWDAQCTNIKSFMLSLDKGLENSTLL